MKAMIVENENLVLKEIEKYKESYNMDNVQKKVNLGCFILLGLFIVAIGFDIGTREYAQISEEIIQNIAVGSSSVLGVYTVLKGLGHYVNYSKRNQEFAEGTLLKVADKFQSLDEGEKENVRTK